MAQLFRTGQKIQSLALFVATGNASVKARNEKMAISTFREKQKTRALSLHQAWKVDQESANITNGFAVHMNF